MSATAVEKFRSIEQDEEQRREKLGISRAETDNPLAPLLENLSRFSDEAMSKIILKLLPVRAYNFCFQGDLSNRITSLFYVSVHVSFI